MPHLISMWGILSLCVLCVSLPLFSCTSEPQVVGGVLELFVASSINNKDTLGLGTIDSPFASITQARDYIRGLKAKGGLYTGVNVYLRSGRYYLDKPLTLETVDSGIDASRPISYMGYPTDPSPVISGGSPITGWIQTGENIWITKVAQVLSDPSYYPKQLWMNGVRRIRARLPSIDGLYYFSSTLNTNTTDKWNEWGFVYNSSDNIQQYHNLGDVNVILFHAWTASHHLVESVFTDNYTIIFQNPTPSLLMPYMTIAGGHRYFIENALEGLDEPGEWYLDRTTGVISYFAFPNENPNNEECVLSNLDNVINLQGNSGDSRLSNIQLTGVTVQNNEWHCPPMPGVCDSQAADFLNTSAIYVTNANNIVIQNVNISNTGTFAVWIDASCSGVLVEGVSTSDLGAGGVRIGRSSPENTGNHIVQNNYLQDGGHVFFEGIGVFIQQSSNNSVLHNEIAHFAYSGVSVGWTWGYQNAPAQDNVVEFNHIYDIGKNTLSDMGGIYTLGVQTTTRINNNIIHDVYSYNYGGWGLYPDEGSSRQVWSNNIVYNCKCSGLHQHYGQNNTFTNNIFAYNGWFDGVIRTEPQPRVNSLHFYTNIIYATNATFFMGDWAYRAEGGSSPFNLFQFDSNVYYSTENQYNSFGNALSLANWQKVGPLGQDTNSTLQDPLFTDAANFDFSLQPNSPAFTYGFIPIDTSKVGPQGIYKKVIAAKSVNIN